MTVAPALEGSAPEWTFRRRRLLRPAWCLIALTVVTIVLGGPAGASPGTLVVFTIDVESNEAFTLPDQIDAVCKNGTACGLMEIVRLLEQRHWSGTFFLNVYKTHEEVGRGDLAEHRGPPSIGPAGRGPSHAPALGL